jgi:hypothetical protein
MLDERGHFLLNDNISEDGNVVNFNLSDSGFFILYYSPSGIPLNVFTITSSGKLIFYSESEIYSSIIPTLTGKILIPDLQFYFNQILTNSIMNKFSIDKPSYFPIDYLENNNSFIRLLFDDNWDTSLNSYNYLYQEVIDRSSWPRMIFSRLMIYPNSSRFFVPVDYDPNDDNLNIFSLQQDDLNLLDILLQYRTNNSIINFSNINFNNLSTNLSKMIYLYLNLKINNDYSLYNNNTLQSNPNNFLETSYESYLAEIMFEYVQSKEIILANLHNEIIT